MWEWNGERYDEEEKERGREEQGENEIRTERRGIDKRKQGMEGEERRDERRGEDGHTCANGTQQQARKEHAENTQRTRKEHAKNAQRTRAASPC